MVQAVAGTLLSAFGGQSRREVQRQPMPSSIAVIGTAKDNKTAKRISREADKERIYAILTQPEVLGMIMAIGGVVAVNNVPLSGDPDKNAFLQGLATTMTVLMSLGYAGVGDLTSLSMAIMAGSGSILSNILDVDLEKANKAFNPLSIILPMDWL